ncbi:hypothetical protein YC2023_002003 [Brassica napus]
MVTQPGSNLVYEHSVYTLERQQSSYSPWRRIEGYRFRSHPNINRHCGSEIYPIDTLP